MARLFNGTNQSLQAASVDLSAVNKLTVSLWLYWDTFANDDHLAMEFTADAGANSGGFYLDPNNSVNGKFQVFMTSVGGGNFTQGEFTRPTAAVFHHYLVHFDMSTNPDTVAVWVDNVSQTISYPFQNNGTGNFANSTLFFMSRGNVSLFAAGREAEVAIWPGVLLSAGEITALSKGFSPALIRSAKPYYWPLIGRTSPEPELFFGKTATINNGATQTPHVRVYYPAAARIAPATTDIGVVPADDLNSPWQDSLTALADGIVVLSDDANNLAESVVAQLAAAADISDNLNNWLDLVQMNVAADQGIVLADNLNNWLDSVSVNLAESPCLPITSYSHITFAQLKTLLANRLSDPNKVFWIDDELGLYIREAIRTWAQLSGFYSKRCTFNTVAGQFYYDLPTVLPDPTDMGYTVTDQQLVKLIQYHFLEPATGSSWSTGTGQTDQFALIDVTNALEKRRNDFLLKTGCVVTSSTITPSATVNRVTLADSTIDVRRVDWRTSGPQSAYSLVRRRDEWSANSFNVGWQSGSSNPPKSYSLAVTPPIQLQFQPPCSTTPLSVGLLTINSGPVLNPAVGVLMSVPDNLSPYVKWGAMADMLGKDGQARDPARSKYCQQRYEEGVEITKALASLEQAQINQSNLWIRALLDLDNFVAGWQNQTGQPTKVGMAGWNLLALAKVPDAIYTVTVDFIPNAPVPTLDADLVQIGRGNLDIILDYAEHLAAFKMAGTEFEATIGHYERMMDSALNNNARLRAVANNLKALRQHPEREEKVNPRKEEEAA